MKKGFVMRERISYKNGDKRFDFKRMGERKMKGKVTTPKYVQLVYPALPDHIKPYAKQVSYDENTLKLENSNTDILLVANTNEYMMSNNTPSDNNTPPNGKE